MENNKCWQGRGALQVGTWNGAALVENRTAVYQTTEHRMTQGSRNSSSTDVPKNWKQALKASLYILLFPIWLKCSPWQHYSQEPKAHGLMSGWTKCGVYTKMEYYSALKRGNSTKELKKKKEEGNSSTYTNTDEPWGHWWWWFNH